jgi:hypothetical protein
MGRGLCHLVRMVGDSLGGLDSLWHWSHRLGFGDNVACLTNEFTAEKTAFRESFNQANNVRKVFLMSF